MTIVTDQLINNKQIVNYCKQYLEKMKRYKFSKEFCNRLANSHTEFEIIDNIKEEA